MRSSKSPIAIAIAGVAGSFVFHGAAETGEAERAALMRLYKMYSRSLAGYTPVRTLAKLADEAAHIILARVHQRLPSLPAGHRGRRGRRPIAAGFGGGC